ncbi:hypothetical protein [Roseivivax lentus]|uniref:hypothetical protein n=1 Tax=Roseivivax lentus TaxID=633194 RepID=UPI00117AA6D1|nr:hypothetical protein [Roseivivax lentus]
MTATKGVVAGVRSLDHRFRVIIAVLVDLNFEPHIKRQLQPCLMVLLLAETPDVMRAATGLHDRNTSRQDVLEIQKTDVVKGACGNDRARIVQPSWTAKHLARTDAQNLDVHQMLLSFTFPATITADR